MWKMKGVGLLLAGISALVVAACLRESSKTDKEWRRQQASARDAMNQYKDTVATLMLRKDIQDAANKE